MPGARWVAGAVTVLLVALAPRYGWHRDELYFLEAGHHLQWGYIDQPPFTPLVARLADAVAPGNLVVLRLAPALAVGMAVLVGSLLVRELGGDDRRQVLGAATVGAGGFVLGVGHLLSTATFDLLAWVVVLWLAARLLRTGDPRTWLAIGGVAGLALLNKHLVVLLVACVGVGLVVERRRALLVSWWLLGGVVLAVVLASPNLWWQASHGWPQLDMAEALEDRIGDENRLTLLPLQVLLLGPLLVGVLVQGARWLAGEGRLFRPLLWAWPTGIVLALISGGRPYYVLPLTLAVALAGVASHGVDRATVALSGATAALLALPVLPLAAVPVTSTVNETSAEQVGWPELVEQVADVVDDLPSGERDRVVLLTASYGEAGAIDRFGPALGLPPAHSPHNSYADFRRPADDGATVVAVRFAVDRLAPHFRSCRQVATVDNGLDVDNEVQGTPILVCRGLRGRWAEVWEELRFVA